MPIVRAEPPEEFRHAMSRRGSFAPRSHGARSRFVYIQLTLDFLERDRLFPSRQRLCLGLQCRLSPIVVFHLPIGLSGQLFEIPFGEQYEILIADLERL